MTARVAAQLAAEGHPWPDAAAAILAERGRLGLDRTAYASLSGIELAALTALEEGARGVPVRVALRDHAATR